MSSHDEVRAEVAEVVGRARAAQRAVDGATQEQVDELVTAVAWAVVRKDRAEALARLAVDESGFGDYADKVTKIHRRVTGVLGDLRGLRPGCLESRAAQWAEDCGPAHSGSEKQRDLQ